MSSRHDRYSRSADNTSHTRQSHPKARTNFMTFTTDSYHSVPVNLGALR